MERLVFTSEKTGKTSHDSAALIHDLFRQLEQEQERELNQYVARGFSTALISQKCSLNLAEDMWT